MSLIDPWTAFQVEFPYHPAWDWVRLVVSVYLGLLTVLYLRIGFRAAVFRLASSTSDEAKAAALGCVTIATLIIPATLNNLVRMGQPVLVWMLPLYILTCVLGTIHIKARL